MLTDIVKVAIISGVIYLLLKAYSYKVFEYFAALLLKFTLRRYNFEFISRQKDLYTFYYKGDADIFIAIVLGSVKFLIHDTERALQVDDILDRKLVEKAINELGG